MYSTQIQPNSTEIQPFLSIFLSKKTHKKCFLQNSPIEMVTIKNPHWHICLYCSGQTADSRTNPEVQQQGGLAYNDISQISQFLLELNECWGRSQGYVNACQPSKPMGTNMSTTGVQLALLFRLSNIKGADTSSELKWNYHQYPFSVSITVKSHHRQMILYTKELWYMRFLPVNKWWKLRL